MRHLNALYTSVLPLPPSSFLAHSHKHSKKKVPATSSLRHPHLSPVFPGFSQFSGTNMQNISPPGFRGVAVLPLICYSFLIALSCLSIASSTRTHCFRGRGEGLWRELVWRGKSGHVGLGERWREKGKKEEEEGGGAGVCLQGCVMQPGRFSPCCDQRTDTHPKPPV